MSQQNLKVAQIANWINTEGLDPNDVIVRKQFADVITIDPSEDHTFVATISTTSIDADNDIVWSKGCHTEKIMLNPVVLFSHKHSEPPIGKITSLQINESSIVAKIKMAPTAFANELWTLVQGGFLRSNSIGFIIKRQLIAGTREFIDFVNKNLGSIDQKVQRIISEFILVEDSLCSIPSNSEALVSAISTKSISVSDKLCKDMDLGKIETDNKFIQCTCASCKTEGCGCTGVDCDDPMCDCNCHDIKAEPGLILEKVADVQIPAVQPVAEVKPIVVEPVVVEPVVVAPVVAAVVEPPRPMEFTLIREGGYKISESDKLQAKQIKQGKIVFI